ncbi:hypothetical protein ASF40_06350 [Microbacterium sp. Leaf288]|uniref:hypothetical protein n=1 Tax=Microbacterium sp. Leaf288 TaxID=1736323 RepID=UPI0006FF5B1D|nr:hypothetical protein [Microbacterium sp. Leaf288]KQP71391.1 hypothetical protein ASF40_06350 [Microbacterium sp. Leaf288]
MLVRALATAALVAVCGLSFAACGTAEAGIQTKQVSGLPDADEVAGGVVEPTDFETTVFLSADEASLIIVTFGSGSCPAVPTALEETAPQEVGVTLGSSGGSMCTSDMAATSNWVELPEDVDVLSPITVHIDDEEIVVEPVPALRTDPSGPEREPEAG